MAQAKITLITFNTLGIPFLTTHRHRNYFYISRLLLARFTYIAQALNNSDAGIILLQEVHLYSLLRFLKRKLTNYPHLSYKKFLYGPKGGLVIFSKHELIEHQYLNYSHRGSFKNKTFATRIVRNGALVCDLKDIPLTVFNTYITGDFSHQWGEENKYSPVQREQLVELATEVKNSHNNNECIIAGDMNIHTNSELYRSFVSSVGLMDFFANATSYTHHPEFLPKWAKAPRLDHVFITQNRKRRVVYKKSDIKQWEKKFSL
jgi:exonuclease III